MTIGIDTNVIVRLLVNDDKTQARAARDLVAGHRVFVSATVLIETEWVLRGAYGLDRAAIAKALGAFLGLRTVTIDAGIDCQDLLTRYRAGFDLADCVHVASAAHARCRGFVTFDKRLSGRAKRTAFAIDVIGQ